MRWPAMAARRPSILTPQKVPRRWAPSGEGPGFRQRRQRQRLLGIVGCERLDAHVFDAFMAGRRSSAPACFHDQHIVAIRHGDWVSLDQLSPSLARRGRGRQRFRLSRAVSSRGAAEEDDGGRITHRKRAAFSEIGMNDRSAFQAGRSRLWVTGGLLPDCVAGVSGTQAGPTQ